ncbi:MAG: hypothetical protein IKR79_05740 [Bacteroidales bacterium]|nr:hypothetical protein [Bacteroidales bacterium]
MLKLFKQYSIGQILVITLTVILLWGRAFVSPVDMSVCNHFSPIYSLAYDALTSMPRLASLLALLLVVGQGISLNIILANYKMTNAHSLLPLFIYIVVMSWNTNMLTITPLLLASIPLLATSRRLLTEGTTHLSTENNFYASFCIGLMTLCYIHTFCYILPFAFVFVIYKLYRWRDFITAILGFIAPFIILFTYAFLVDKLDYDLILIHYDLTNLKLQWLSAPLLQKLPSFILIAILAASLAKQIFSLNDRTVNQRINTGIICLPLLASALMAFYTEPKSLVVQSLALPFAFLGTRFFMTERKRQWISETLLWIFILSALINMFF